jgi:hypothetical protein
MDSPEDGLSAPLLDSVTQDFKNLIPKKKNLEDLNWDNSFVRELPSDPRTDPYPREVALTFIQFISIEMKLGLQFTISLMFSSFSGVTCLLYKSISIGSSR